jgi:uncharacterized Ntn-hydrolase superfamily protein
VTFSIAARCERTGALGGAVSSSSIAVASRCLWGSPHGIVLTQNVTDPALGLIGLGWLAAHHGADAALQMVRQARRHAEWRQLAVLDTDGASAWFSGAHTLGISAAVQGCNCVALGNMLASPEVPATMTAAFEASGDLPLATRLLAAMEAGLAAGGELGPVHSIGLCVYLREAWPVVDLRVDWSDSPIADVARLWVAYEPQMADYVQRAKDPTRAPPYEVPGDVQATAGDE